MTAVPPVTTEEKPASPEYVKSVLAIYRESGFPLIDQVVARQLLTAAIDDQTRRGLFALHWAGRDFTSDDPAIWEAARALLARFDGLHDRHARGVINDAAYHAQLRDLARCSWPVFAATVHLWRAKAVADEHAVRLCHRHLGKGI